MKTITLRQVICPDTQFTNQFGFINYECLQCFTRVGRYGYRPYDISNTQIHFGEFKLEFIS